jgi:hypothetical protein
VFHISNIYQTNKLIRINRYLFIKLEFIVCAFHNNNNNNDISRSILMTLEFRHNLQFGVWRKKRKNTIQDKTKIYG